MVSHLVVNMYMFSWYIIYIYKNWLYYVEKGTFFLHGIFSSYTYILSKDWFFRLAGLAPASPLASSLVTLARFGRMRKPHPWTTKASPWSHGFADTVSCFTSPVFFDSKTQAEACIFDSCLKTDCCLKTDSSDWPGWVGWFLNAVHTTCF